MARILASSRAQSYSLPLTSQTSVNPLYRMWQTEEGRLDVAINGHYLEYWCEDFELQLLWLK